LRPLEQEYKLRLRERLEKAKQYRVARAEANKQAFRFCQKCFEKGKKYCNCQLKNLDPMQRALANAERQKHAKRLGDSMFLEESAMTEFSHSSEDAESHIMG
jgi:hypothetical protein